MREKLFDTTGMTSSERIFHTPSIFARNSLNYVQEVGVLKSLKPHVCARENIESFLFFMVLEGEGRVFSEGKNYTVKKGDGVFLDCRNYYEHQSSEENPWEIKWIHFDGLEVKRCFDELVSKKEFVPVFALGKNAEVYASLWEKIKEAQNRKTLLDEMDSSRFLFEIFTLCMRDMQNGNGGAEDLEGKLSPSDFEALRECINERFAEDGLAEELAGKYGLDTDGLNSLFGKKYGISVTDYIFNRKFNKAKEMLRFTIKPVEEIAKESGLGSEAVLRGLFEENEKMSPEDYRKKWAQWIKG